MRTWLLSTLLALGFIFVPDYAVAVEPISSGQKVRVRVTTTNDPATINASTLRAIINNDATAPRFIKPLDLNGQLFLPFKDFLQLFDFPIHEDQTTSRWRGFFISPDNQFSLDIEALDAQIKTTHHPVTRQDIRKKDGQLYISAKALESWFGVSIRDVSHMAGSIHFSTSFVSPSEAQALRKKKRLELLGPYTRMEPATSAFPEAPQASFGLPSLAKANATTQKHNLSGTTHAGYEVELYHNDKLISFQYADETGLYRFQDIPLQLGENVFRIAIYGAQGQYEERKERITSEIPLVKNFKVTPPVTPKKEKETKETIALKDARAAMTVSTDVQQLPVQAKNWTELSVIQGGVVVGVLEAYIGLRGTFLRLDAFLRYLGIAYNQQASSDLLEIAASDNRQISLDIGQRAYIENGQQHSLYDTDAFKDEGKIYANTSLLYRLFPHSAFVVNQALQKIEVPEKIVKEPTTQATQQATDKKDLAPTPEAAPVQPVIIDDLSGQQRLSGTTAPAKEGQEAEDVLHIEQTATAAATAPTPEDSEQSKGEPLILQPQIKNLAPMAEFIEALDFPGQVFLPLNDLFQIIGFPIKFDEAKNEARGFFFVPENEFYLNVDKKEVRAASKSMEITRRDVRKSDGQIYVSTESFSDWFGIACEVDRGRGTLHLKTDKLFPIEENEERQKRWNKLLNVVTPTDEDKPLLQNPYQAIDYPTVDVNIGTDYTHNKTSGSNGNAFASQYNLQGAMELGYLTSQFYIQGATNNNAINTMRLQAGRKDPTANLLSGLHATEFAFGDVTSPSVSLVTSNSLGRGLTMTNRSVTAPENFDMRSFSGDSVPGYEVELYRNNVLVSFQTVDASGRYNFTDVPILYGENTFRLVFYGSQGQREERIETVSASSALLKEGQFEYTIGAEQRGVSLIPLSKLALSNPETPDGAQLVSSFRYGVTKNYTFGGSLIETQLGDGPHQYVTTSSGSNIYGVLSETSFARDMTTGGWASGMSVLSGFEGVSLRARYRQYNDFVSESVNNSSTPLQSDASLNANAQVFLPIVQDFSLGLSGEREQFVDGALVPRYTYGLQLSKALWGVSFSNKLDYIVADENKVQDTFGLQTRLWDINFRTTGIYDLKPVQQFRNATFMMDYRLANKLSGQSLLDRDITTGRTTFGQNINWDFEKFRLSFNNQVSDGGDYSLGMNLLFSMNHNKVTNNWQMQPQQTSSGGAIAGRVFVDENNNGVYDQGEKLLPEAKVRVDRAAVKLDDEGYFVAPVAPYGTSKVEINESSLSDPLLTPKEKGYRVQTRPGDTVVVNFPMVHTTIIDGTSYFLEGESQREIGNIVIELQDKDSKPLRRVISEIDGYFSFDKVQKGEYWISVPEEVLESLNATLVNKIHIIIDAIDGFISDNNILLQQKEDLTVPPAFTAPLPNLPPSLPPPPLPNPPTLPVPVKEEKVAKSKAVDSPEDSDPPDETNSDIDQEMLESNLADTNALEITP